MKNLVIIGAGGMGRSVFDIVSECSSCGTDFIIKGFIDDNLKSLEGFENYPPLLGTINEYMPNENDVFISSMGGEARKKCCLKIIEKGGEFITIIHPTARIGSNVKIGMGNIIGAFVSIGADVCIGDYNMIQAYTVIGHDSKIGSWSRIDTHVVCVGGIIVMDNVTIHTNAVINHRVVIENGAHVAACSFVIRRVKEGVTVFGNPAKKLDV